MNRRTMTPLPTVALLLASAAGAWVTADAAAAAPLAQASGTCAGRPATTVVAFADAALAEAVRDALTLAEQDDLTCGVVSRLTELDARETGIESLEGIENLTGLTRLDLGVNAIHDLGPLAGLTSLRELDLAANTVQDLRPLSGLTGLRELDVWDNRITDVGPLAGLTGLEVLWLGLNEIRDLGPLAGLVNLTVLHIRENQVSDLAPLRGLTRMKDLNITYNSVSDLSALAGMTELTTLRVYNNPIDDIGVLRGLTELSELHIHDLPELSNITPLLENEGLGSGDVVYTMNSGVTCEDAGALRAKGVRVGTDCALRAVLEWRWAILGALAVAAVGVVAAGRRQRMRRVAGPGVLRPR